MHVIAPDGDAKFWLEPRIVLAHASGFKPKDIGLLAKIIEERSDEIKKEWKRHFGR